ncbi:MAG: tetratricopeptide repeat protein [bacterium]
MINFLNRVIKFSLYSLIFLIPLFWLPFSFEAYEFNKQYLLVFLVLMAVLAWLAKLVLVGKEMTFKRTPLDIFVGGFLLVAVLSAVFSVDKLSSLFGFYGRFSDSLIGLLSLGVLYFVITNNVGCPEAKPRKETDSQKIGVNGLLKAFLYSSFFAIIISYLSVFDVWSKISAGAKVPMPLIMFQRYFNTLSGSMEGLAVFLSVVAVLLTGLILISKWSLKQLGYWLPLAAILSLLVIVDYEPAWLILAVSFILFLTFALWKRLFKENVNKLLLPIILTIIAIFGMTSGIQKIAFFNLPQEQTLGQKTSWQVALGVATENAKSGFLGSGVGTFSYDFTKEKPVGFNQSQLWQIRFDRAGSHLAEILGTMGFLGFLSWLGLAGMFLLISYFLINSQKLSALPFLMALAALITSQMFYYQNTALAFSFWLVLGLGAVNWQKTISTKTFSFKDFPELNLIFTTLLIIVFLGVGVVFYWGQRFYSADKSFFQAQIAASGQSQSDLLEKAVKLNPLQPQYWAVLSRIYLRQVREDVQKELTSQEQLQLQVKIARAIEAAKIATELGPSQVAAYETLAMVYRDIGFMPGAKDWAEKSFEKAIELEPTNPVLRTELAKFWLAGSADDIAKMKEALAEVKKLKPDYPDALFLEAEIYEKEGDLPKAVAIMEGLALDYSFDTDILFRLGQLYFNNRQTDDSVAIFQRIVTLVSNHSNALYSLGLAYQVKGQEAEAIKYFEKVLELNPDNQEVKELIKELNK